MIELSPPIWENHFTFKIAFIILYILSVNSPMGHIMNTREEIHKIPELFKERTRAEVAKELGWSVRKVDYWVKRLRKSGIEVPTYKGRRGMVLT